LGRISKPYCQTAPTPGFQIGRQFNEVSDADSLAVVDPPVKSRFMVKIQKTISGILGRSKRRIIASLHRREHLLPDWGPVVSFTFDDFPRSALEMGGNILKAYGSCGTYYAAMGLMGGVGQLGEYFCLEDLKRLLADGHELGSHTFSHVSCRKTTFPAFEADAQKGREAIINFTGRPEAHQFAYPFGHITLKAKGRIGSQMSSCRSTIKGVNVSPVDLHLLHANCLYHRITDFGSIDQLLRVNDRQRGWLIFYTHDISENPSLFGCKPGQFENVVRSAVHSRARILTVGSVLAGTMGGVPAGAIPGTV
jgi:peptidoglycan/xylan/chitin deacetylase (PgdA/CDA1 family)